MAMKSPRDLIPINGEMRCPSSNGFFFTSTTMGIIYSVVARGKVILAHYASCHGNFSEVAQQVLRNISVETDKRLSYASGEYMYHYLSEGDVVYLCITDDEFERSKAFLFLSNIKNRFEEMYRDSSIQNALPFAMNSDFSVVLKEEMKQYTNATLSMLPSQKLDNIQVRNLDILGDGEMEQLELLESSDTVSVRSYESILNPKLRAKCHNWLRQHWKIIVLSIIILVVVVTVAVTVGVCLKGENNNCGR